MDVSEFVQRIRQIFQHWLEISTMLSDGGLFSLISICQAYPYPCTVYGIYGGCHNLLLKSMVHFLVKLLSRL